MTALQQHDSLAPHPALNWPVEITEFAYIGDKLVDRKKTTAIVREAWIRDSDQTPSPLELCGTDVPGGIHFAQPFESFLWEVLRDAGFYPDPRNAELASTPIGKGGHPVDAGILWEWPPVSRPCVGDPRMDPTVLEEGCMLPWVGPATFFGIEEP